MWLLGRRVLLSWCYHVLLNSKYSVMIFAGNDLLVYSYESSSQPKASSTDDALRSFLSRSASQNNTLSTSGRASEQPKRTPVSKEEMEAILLGGCIN